MKEKLTNGFYGFFTSKKVDAVQNIALAVIILYFIAQISLSIIAKS